MTEQEKCTHVCVHWFKAEGEKDVVGGTTCESADSFHLSPAVDGWSTGEEQMHWEKQRVKLNIYRRKQQFRRRRTKKARKPPRPKFTSNRVLETVPDAVAQAIVASELKAEQEYNDMYDGLGGTGTAECLNVRLQVRTHIVCRYID